MLSSAKDKSKQEDKIRCVYKVCCTCGDHYIGESGRKLGTRIEEHQAACRVADFGHSPIAEHAWQDRHQICWDEVEILHLSSNMLERRIEESIFINLSSPSNTMNRDTSLELSPLLLRAARLYQP